MIERMIVRFFTYFWLYFDFMEKEGKKIVEKRHHLFPILSDSILDQ